MKKNSSFAVQIQLGNLDNEIREASVWSPESEWSFHFEADYFRQSLRDMGVEPKSDLIQAARKRFRTLARRGKLD